MVQRQDGLRHGRHGIHGESPHRETPPIVPRGEGLHVSAAQAWRGHQAESARHSQF